MKGQPRRLVRFLEGAFPKDTEFITGFTTRNVYSMKGKNKDYIFDRLENGSSKEFMRNGYTALPISH